MKAARPTPASRSSRSTRPATSTGWDPTTQLGDAGQSPYTRGVRKDDVPGPAVDDAAVLRVRDAEATNERWKLLLPHGSTGLSCAFDLPTQMGYDSDHPRAEGEVGKVGVAIDSLDDMRAAARRAAARHRSRRR